MHLRVIAILIAIFSQLCWAETYQPVKTVAIIPANAPSTFTINSSSTGGLFIPLINAIQASENSQRTAEFTKRMKRSGINYGDFLTAKVSEYLSAEGYEVKLLSEISLLDYDKESIDYEQQKINADIGLHIKIEGMGFYAGYSDEKYTPKVNVSVVSFTSGASEYPYQTTIYYGAAARRGKEWAIFAPEPSIITNPALLISDESLANGIFLTALDEISKLIAKQFKSTTPPK